jgi:biopolymer transport protein ExbD
MPRVTERTRTLARVPRRSNEGIAYESQIGSILDARVPYARVVEVIDAVQKSGVEGVTLLTAQPETTDQGKKARGSQGLEMRVVNQKR